MAITIAACVVAAALLLSRAAEERHTIDHRALEAAKALSFGFDQEVAAVNYLLKGLSKSPTLLSGDVKAFYDQLKATPVPEGSWLILNDLERQVANTLRPFDRRCRGMWISRTTARPSIGSGIEDGRLRPDAGSSEGQHRRGSQPPARRSGRPDEGHLTIILTEARLGAILDDQRPPAGWMKGSTTASSSRSWPTGTVTKGLTCLLPQPWPPASPTPDRTARSRGRSRPSMTVGSRSSSPTAVRARRTGRAWSRCRWPISMHRSPPPCGGWPDRRLSSCSPEGLAAWFTARQVEQPLQVLSDQVTGAKKQVSELSGQLLALQEEERQRIARELHDSTAQHLVAANLGLAG